MAYRGYKNKEQRKVYLRRYMRRQREYHHRVRLLAVKGLGGRCVACGTEDLSKLNIHHIDEDRTNNSEENLVILCKECHRKIHWSPFSPYYDEREKQQVLEAIEKCKGRKVELKPRGVAVFLEGLERLRKMEPKEKTI